MSAFDILELCEYKDGRPEAKVKPFRVFILIKSLEGLEDESTAAKLFNAAKKLKLNPAYIPVDEVQVDLEKSDNSHVVLNLEGSQLMVSENDLVHVRVNATNPITGSIVSVLEKIGAFTVNSYNSSCVAENKYLTGHLLKVCGFNTPKTTLVTSDKQIEKLGVKTPVILKKIFGSEGIGVTLVESQRGLLSHIQHYIQAQSSVLVQEYLDTSEDYRAIILNSKVLAGVERSKPKDDFRSNIDYGSKHTPYEIPEADQVELQNIAKALGLFYCAIDYIKKDDKIYVLEVNSMAGSGDNYYSHVHAKVIDGVQLIEYVSQYLSNKKHWQQRLNIVGLIEKITIKDVGEFKAKLDTGNESDNSLHAEKIKSLGTKVEFSIRGKKFVKPILDRVKIRQGENVETRFVVAFDVRFNGKDTTDVLFNLNNREELDYDVLIGAKFMSEHRLCVNPKLGFKK